MNFGEIKNWVEIGVVRNDLQSEYGEAVNRAARYIADCRDWTWMKKTATEKWASNTKSIRLPGDFKQFTDPQSAITSTYGGSTGVPFPVQFQIKPKKELERLATIGWSGYYAALNWSYYPLLRKEK